ncbi:MAG: hypothetical protein OEZ21_07925 [Candidatus Bathyarchaeota archaeon]|nr:hypothetical protein [Candidatus Bathyarchaeota archaeon]MDH5746863.1 hypothetical protein [Candidatus Bathyarchaeota archaeon]
MNWKMFIARHWKAALLLLQLGLLTFMVTTGKAFAEPIDCPILP